MLQSLGVPVLLVDSNYRKAAEARMQGFRAVNEQITTEHIVEQLDLRGIGYSAGDDGERSGQFAGDDPTRRGLRQCEAVSTRPRTKAQRGTKNPWPDI